MIDDKEISALVVSVTLATIADVKVVDGVATSCDATKTLEVIRDFVNKMEARFDQDRAAQRAVLAQLQQAMGNVFKHLQCPSHQFNTWEQQVTEQIDILTDERDEACNELNRYNTELDAVLDFPGAVRVREGGGPEELCASIAVTVAKLRSAETKLVKSLEDAIVERNSYRAKFLASDLSQ